MPDIKDNASVDHSEANLDDGERPRVLLDLGHNLEKPWWRLSHLVKLNLWLLVPLITSYVSGFDGSMLNGMQSLPIWQQGMYLTHAIDSSDS